MKPGEALRSRRVRTGIGTTVLACATACSSAPHQVQAQGRHRLAPTAVPATRTTNGQPTTLRLNDVVLTPSDVTRPTDGGRTATATPKSGITAGRVTAVPVHAADDARIRTLLTWCTHTAATEDAAVTVYGPRLTLMGRHGRNFVYSYARALAAGTSAQQARYAARLADCWRDVLLPVFAATLDPHIDDLTQSTSVRRLRGIAVSYGRAQAVEGVIHWHPTPAQTERSVYDVAVVFGKHSMVTVLAGGADGLTTGVTHVASDVAAIAARLAAAQQPNR